MNPVHSAAETGALAKRPTAASRRETLRDRRRGSLAVVASMSRGSAARGIIAVCVFAFAAIASAATAMYNETADAKAEIRSALADAQRDNVPVLVVFGANWCGDCKVLDAAFKSGPSAPLIARQYKVVKVDVGRFNHNVDIAQGYGVPLKSGIPAVAVLSPQGAVIYATREGELADARNMGDAGIYAFFSKVAPSKAK